MDQVIVRTHGSYRTTVTARQHTLHADVPHSSGGDDSAATPEEMLLGALGSCMAETALMYARRKGFPLEDVEIELAVERFNAADYAEYDGDAPFIHEIRERITLNGPLNDGQRARILEITRKCPVRRIISNPVFFRETLADGLPSNI